MAKPPRAATGSKQEIDVLLRHERAAPERPVLEALLAVRCFGEGAARAAATRLLDGHAPWGSDLGPGQEFLLGAPSPHQSALFVEVLRGGEGRTLEAIGRQRGMNAPAVGDAAQRAGRRIRAVLPGAPPPWPWLVTELRRRLGAVTTEGIIGDVLARLGATPGSVAALLASWLAGPFRSVRGHPGWLARDPVALLGHSARCVRADGGVRRLGDLTGELADLEIATGMLVPWLHAFGAAIVHDLVVATAGPLPDAVERLLDAHGTARSLAELAEDLASGGRTVDAATLAACIRGRRFRTLEDGAVRLAAWGEPTRGASARRTGQEPAPSTPAGAAADRPTAARRHGPPRATEGHRGPRPAPPRVGGHDSAPATAEQLRLRVKVDDAVLRGEEAVVPAELVDGLGIAAGGRRTFSCRWGPVTLAADGPRPKRGSLRAVARAAGARPGDTLLLWFSLAGDLVVEVREAAHPKRGRTAPPGNEGPGPFSTPAPDAMVLRGAARPAGLAGTEPGQLQILFTGTTSQGAR